MRRPASIGSLVLAITLGACGGPALQNAPHPNNAMMAGAAAAVAGAITLADPSAAGHKPETEVGADGKPIVVKQTVPSDVFDRAENQPPKANTTAQPPQPRAQPQGQPPPKAQDPGDPLLQP